LENDKLWSKDLTNEILANPSQINNFAPELQKIITKLRETFIITLDNNIWLNIEHIDDVYEDIQKYFQQDIRQGKPSFPKRRKRRRTERSGDIYMHALRIHLTKTRVHWPTI
jgi:hypothetical protein